MPRFASPMALIALALVTILPGCDKSDLKDVVKHDTDPEHVPTVVTHNVQTVISDSGRTRYRITAPLWNMFEEAKSPHWTFPQGAVAEELDEQFHVVSSIKCDSAHFDVPQNLWSLNGNVNITTLEGDRILTDQMFWNTAVHEFYSDAFIHLEKQDRVIEGYGYRSNEQLTKYELRRVSAILPVDDSKMPH